MALYSTSNKINITEVDGTSFKGRYAADGSWNGVNKTGVTSYVGLINQCGAINYSINNSSSPVPLYATNGSLNLTDQGLLNGALSVSINAINALSLASTMLAFESNGLAIDFTDSAFLNSTGFYGSARIKDLTTPANEYNSSPTNTASSLLTYSSPSPKMTMGPSGVMRFGAHNLCLQSETLTSASWTKEQATAAVSTAITAAPGYPTYYKISEDSTAAAQHRIGQPITTVTGFIYDISIVACAAERSVVWIYGDAGSKGRYFDLSNGTVAGTISGSPYASSITSLGDGWYRCSIRLLASATGAVYVGIAATSGTISYNGVAGSGIYVTGVQVSRYPADTTYLATTSSARYALPYEWSAAGALQGILVEEARTNLLVYSRQLDNAAWIKSNATVSADVRADIFGGTGADAIVENATNSSHSVYQTITTSAVAYAVSAIVEAGAQSYAYVALYDVVDTHGYYYDLATGAVGSATGTASGGAITNLGGGRYRVSFTVTPAANAGSRFTIYSATGTTAGSQTYLGTSATAIYVHHAQLETGAFATSPIETFGATVTRAADNISLATTAFPISASAVTLMAKFKDATVPSGQYSFMLHYGTDGNNRAGMAVKGNGAVNCFAATAGSFFYDNDSKNDFSGTLTGSSTHKVAMRVTTNDFRAAADGSLGTLDSVGTYSLSPTTLGIGAYTVGGSGQYSKHMQSVLVVPRAYVDAELQALTT